MSSQVARMSVDTVESYLCLLRKLRQNVNDYCYDIDGDEAKMAKVKEYYKLIAEGIAGCYENASDLQKKRDYIEDWTAKLLNASNKLALDDFDSCKAVVEEVRVFVDNMPVVLTQTQEIILDLRKVKSKMEQDKKVAVNRMNRLQKERDTKETAWRKVDEEIKAAKEKSDEKDARLKKLREVMQRLRQQWLHFIPNSSGQ